MPLAGVRVFVVEDEALVLLELEDLLADLGCTVVGSALRIEEALSMAQSVQCDVAVLDVNVGGARIDTVAEALAHRNIPFIFVTGYERNVLPAAFRDQPLLIKPYGKADLEQSLKMCIDR
ncbi:MAG TPA: response regulator [Reyranella sp.]|nr:response regulator [Reyranella sp.]